MIDMASFAGSNNLASPMMFFIDDFFRADLANLIEKGTESYKWSYHHKSDVNDPSHNKFFAFDLWTNSSEDNLFYVIWKQIYKEVQSVQDCECCHIYANGQVKGQNGNWHTDHADKTVIYFPIAWNQAWGGSTYFKINGSDKEIHYRKNRLIVFDATIPHYGSAPEVDNILRVSIAFKLRFKSKHTDTPVELHLTEGATNKLD